MREVQHRRFRAMLGAITPGGSIGPRLNRLKFALAKRQHAVEVSPLISASPKTPLGTIVDDRPEVLAFLRAPYLCAGWSVEERLARFTSHIDMLAAHPPLGFPVAQSIGLMPLADIAPDLHVVLDKPMWFHREGIVTLNLFEGNTRLFSLVFALEPAGNDLRALIGGIQGRNLPAILDRYRDLTKQAHGIRPRDLVIELFRMVCARLGVSEIHAVSDRGRHVRHRYFGRDVLRPLPLDYDEIWRDRGGTEIDQWFFTIPVQSERRADADIPAKKRSMYRQRYALLDMLDAKMSSAWPRMTPVTRPDAD